MSRVRKILLLVVVAAALVWVGLRVEFGGATLWDRVAALGRPESPRAATRDGGNGAPMESVRPDERRALERLIAEEGAE